MAELKNEVVIKSIATARRITRDLDFIKEQWELYKLEKKAEELAKCKRKFARKSSCTDSSCHLSCHVDISNSDAPTINNPDFGPGEEERFVAEMDKKQIATEDHKDVTEALAPYAGIVKRPVTIARPQ